MSQQPETNSSTQSASKRTFAVTSTYTTTAAAVTTLVFWLLHELFGVDAPELVQGAATTIMVAVFGYLAPPRKLGKRGRL